MILTIGGQSPLYKKIHDYMTHLITADSFLPSLMRTAFLHAMHSRRHHV